MTFSAQAAAEPLFCTAAALLCCFWTEQCLLLQSISLKESQEPNYIMWEGETLNASHSSPPPPAH